MSKKVKDSPDYEVSKNMITWSCIVAGLAARGRQNPACQTKIAVLTILTIFYLTVNNSVIWQVTSKCQRR